MTGPGPGEWDGDPASTFPIRVGLLSDYRTMGQPIRPEQLSRFGPFALIAGKVVESPRGIPEDAEAWCLDGDKHWRPMSEAPPAPPTPKSRKAKKTASMARMTDPDERQ